jgi:cyclic pyranopterin monophosphate synthase
LSSVERPLSHLNSRGEVHIVDVTEKKVTSRRAVAESWVQMNTPAYRALCSGETPKGDVLATVRLAAIMAVKKTSELIPLCHPLAVESVSCEIDLKSVNKAHLRVSVSTTQKTGVEMEAMTGASVAALTLYDMLKALDKGMVIGPTQLLEKHGGKSGSFQRKA